VPAAATPTFHHGDFGAADLLEAKAGRTISVCLPARDEEATVGAIVSTLRRQLVERIPLVDEVLVVDDRSTDTTAQVAADAGARVVSTVDLLPECGPGGGKGDALWKSLFASTGDLVVWCDADVRNFGPRFVVGLLGPLLTRSDVVFSKGYYERPLDGAAVGGGRVTELVARPLISLLFPQLASIVQPLAGEYAGRRDVLEELPFVEGYGVDLALLVDAARRHGTRAIAQVDLGVRVHRNRPVDELAPQAMAILQTALDRAGVERRREWSSLLVRPGLDPVEVGVAERPPLVDIPAYRARTA